MFSANDLKNKRRIISCFSWCFTAAFLIFTNAYAQVRIAKDNSLPIEPSAMLEIVSPSGSPMGFLPPRVQLNNTTSWGLSGTAVESMIVYNLNTALPNGLGLYMWTSGKWSKLINDAVISGAVTSGPSYGFSMLSSDQAIPNGSAGTGTIINISQARSSANNPSSIISSSKINLKANRTYRLRADGYLTGSSAASAFVYLSWRKTGTGNTSYVGNRALLLAANWSGSYSSGSQATALIKVGGTDESYELYVSDSNNSPVISAEGFFVDVQEIETSSPLMLADDDKFSYTETATGLNWIDGNPIYEKTFVLNATTTPTASTWLSTASTSFNHNIVGLGTVVFARGTINQSGTWYPLPYGINSSPSMAVTSTTIDSRNTSSSSWTGSTLYITLQYTKN